MSVNQIKIKSNVSLIKQLSDHKCTLIQIKCKTVNKVNKVCIDSLQDNNYHSLRHAYNSLWQG